MEGIDYTAWRFWFDVLQVVMTGSIGIYVWSSNRQRVTRERIASLEDDVDKRLDNHADRLTRVEQRLEDLPTHDDIGKIYERINSVDNALNRLNGLFEGIASSVGRINDYLINRSNQ